MIDTAMIHFGLLRDKVVREEIPIEDLSVYKDKFIAYARRLLSDGSKISLDELKAFLFLCLDYYTYSPNGDVLIPDSIYDECMRMYTAREEQFFYADSIGISKWNFIDHKIPGMVGTLDKIYTYKELKDYLIKYTGITKFTLAPKFDGVSCCIEVSDGEIVSGATRYDGRMGQDITKLVKRAGNSENFMVSGLHSGFYKCELCVGKSDFNELITLKVYANRRSATTGIVNTPSNLKYAKYVTIVPLVFYDGRGTMEYLAPLQGTADYYCPADLMDDIERMLEKIRSVDFEYRTDGVVIYPDRYKLGDPNEKDILENAIAFKVNTAEAKTRIKYGYMSIGRLGRAIPMLKVEPVEVNETIVNDASLSSYNKFLSMNLHENEEVIVYSAGDVIPQVKLPTVRTNFHNAEELKISKQCPYCGQKMSRENSEYYCRNTQCVRVITGKISNFFIKMGVAGFSDKTIETIYEALGLNTIIEFLNLTVSDLMRIAGFDTVSAESFVKEMSKIKNNNTPISTFFGALGIDRISVKKCQKIFETISFDELLRKKNLDKLLWTLQTVDGIGPKTAIVFIDFVKYNREDIEEVSKYLKLVNDNVYDYNIVFTGFTDAELSKRFEELGIATGSSVTGQTIAVIAASLDRESTKSKAAIKKGIPIYHLGEVETVIESLIDQRKM